LNWSKKAKKAKISFALFQKQKKPKELKEAKNYEFGLKRPKVVLRKKKGS